MTEFSFSPSSQPEAKVDQDLSAGVFDFKEALFSSEESAVAFARHVAGDMLGRPECGVMSQKIGSEFAAQIVVKRELFYWEPPIPVPGTILVDSSRQPRALDFRAYTEECDSGHELHWIEDLQGTTLKSMLEPR